MSTKFSLFITGSSGFIGSHLVRELQRHGHIISILEGSILDLESVRLQVLSFSKQDTSLPKTIIHLAGLSSPPKCEKSPTEAFQVNVLGTSYLLDAIRLGFNGFKKPKLIFSSTAHVYNQTLSEINPITEQTKIQIKSVYAETKIQTESLVKDFANRFDVPSVVLRLFNHAHISQTPDFFVSSMYHQIKNLNPSQNNISVGNLNLYRDIGSLPDLINAFCSLVEAKQFNNIFDIYNICSGRTIKLLDIVQFLAQTLNRSDLIFEVDPQRLRTQEPTVIVGSCKKIEKDYGWKPQFTDLSYLVKPFS